MKLYIWEGNGISDAYHDDGTLVVLAESAEQAREIVRAERREHDARMKAWEVERDALLKGPWGIHTPENRELGSRYPGYKFGALFDGKDEALDRDPDVIVGIDKPTIVAFNGGGYD